MKVKKWDLMSATLHILLGQKRSMVLLENSSQNEIKKWDDSL